MNKSTIIMPCNGSFTDPQSTLGWGVVDFDWSNAEDCVCVNNSVV